MSLYNQINTEIKKDAADAANTFKILLMVFSTIFIIMQIFGNYPQPAGQLNQTPKIEVKCGIINESVGSCKRSELEKETDPNNWKYQAEQIQVQAEEKEQEAPSQSNPAPSKVEVVEATEEQPAQVSKPEQTAEVKSSFTDRAVSLGVSDALAQAMQQAAQEYQIKPEYLLAIGLSENAKSPWEIGDGGWSYGPFQIYLNVHESTDLHPSMMDCAKDFLCSSRWTARRVRDKYLKVYGEKGWILSLSKHNGQVYCPKNPKNVKACAVDEITGPISYQKKIEKNGLASGLSY